MPSIMSGLFGASMFSIWLQRRVYLDCKSPFLLELRPSLHLLHGYWSWLASFDANH